KLFGFFSYERIKNSGIVTGQNWFETPQLLASAPSGSLASRYGAYPGESPAISGVVDQTCGSIGLIDAATATTLIADGTPNVQGANCAEITGQGLDVGSPLIGVALGVMDPSQFGQTTDPVTGKTYYLPGLGGDGTG